MSQLIHSTTATGLHFQQRITAKLSVQASWIDRDNGNVVFVNGFTENLGETSLSVNLDVLPPVGSEVNIRLMNEDKFIFETKTRVIRLERDPSKPLAALSVTGNRKKWQEVVLPAAQDWLSEHLRLNYEDDWLN